MPWWKAAFSRMCSVNLASSKPQRGSRGKNLRFAVDTGGTFTDLVVADKLGGMQMFKTATVPHDPVAGVIEALRIAAHSAAESLDRFLGRGEMLVHGTTHAINAIITGSTARTAFLTTQGHPDTLVFREGGRTQPFNFTVPYPEPYIPKALTFEIPERILADGSVHKPLDEAGVIKALDALKQRGVEAVSVCLLWSIVNCSHEVRIGELIEELLPGVPYTLSHQLNPSLREYRRAMSACIDASLKPLMSTYMRGLAGRLKEAGFNGRILVVTSMGGVMDAADAAEAPIHLINSGPSMAPVAAQAYAGADAEVIVGDTGGTTFDVSLVRNGRIPTTRETWLGQPFLSQMTGMPSVDVKSIGAGGGSLAWVDPGGLLHVGPQSAGAVPGPACYGRGGMRPTVTDAALILGFIDAATFLGGRMRVDVAAASMAIEREIADRLGLSIEDAAAAVIELATEHMVQAIVDMTVNQGVDPTHAVLVAGGGAAGLNCLAIARRLGCRRVIVPETGAALSAVGGLLSDLTTQRRAMLHTDTRAFAYEGVNTVLRTLEKSCQAFAEGPGAGASEVTIAWTTEARYPDQAWEIEVPLCGSTFAGPEDVARLVADFHRSHKEIFAISDPNSAIEAIGWGAEVRCRINSGRPGRLASADGHCRIGSRPVRFLGTKAIEAPVYRFEALPIAADFSGPAIVESDFTSIVVDPNASGYRDELGTLVLEINE